ncbi:proteasome subunit beta type-11a [Hypomesus transpacificus]|uniref:proteasome subunit beta type-11a n=1 Tax=Hypomesus transpacificus TaxID=137520 RepID=UPI001F07E5B0|nr:proteasome subunit beta type-11a [Hypomesus transpacificus]
MALQDVCGFQDNLNHHRWHTPDSVSRAMEHNPPNLDTTNGQNLGWQSCKSSDRYGGFPLHFFIPTPQSSVQLNRLSSAFSTSSPSRPVQRPFPLCHGTTTLGFVFQGGVIAAADTRASAGGLVACPSVQKLMPLHSHLVVASSGSGADCMLWERILAREIRLYQLRHHRRLSIGGSAKLLSHMLHPFKGTEVCVAATLCGWDEEVAKVASSDRLEPEVPGSGSLATMPLKKTEESERQGVIQDGLAQGVCDGVGQVGTNIGPSRYPASGRYGPKVIYVCSDGARLQGDLFSVGSGSPYAYGVLDGGFSWSLSEKEAFSLAREAVFRATHRDAYSGNSVDLYHITAQGWSRRDREDLKEEYYRKKEGLRKRVQERIDETKM